MFFYHVFDVNVRKENVCNSYERMHVDEIIKRPEIGMLFSFIIRNSCI